MVFIQVGAEIFRAQSICCRQEEEKNEFPAARRFICWLVLPFRRFFFLDSLDFFISSFLLSNSRKSVRWSVVPVAPVGMCVRYEGERGSGPKGADDLCWAKI